MRITVPDKCAGWKISTNITCPDESMGRRISTRGDKINVNDLEMDRILSKAEVLIEALPYIQKFNRRIIVVKYGGSAMTDPMLQKNVIKDVVLLKLVGFKPIIVHGGGKEISS